MTYPRILAQIGSIPWAITTEAMEGIYRAVEVGLTPEDRQFFHKSEPAAYDIFDGVAEDRKSFVSNGTGYLFVDGPVVPRDGGIQKVSGMASIQTLTREFKELVVDRTVDKIDMIMDTPGGAVAGVSDFAKLLEASPKPVRAFALGQAASAGYWIAAGASEIWAVDTGSVGSIGVIFKPARFDPEAIVSSQSPNKWPDASTVAGRQVIQTRVDDLANVMIQYIARRRGVEPEYVVDNFGRGGTLLANKALEVGMIDGIATLSGFVAGQLGVTAVDTAATPAFRDYPVVTRPWDSTAAVRRLREATGSTEKPSASYRDGFFYYDGEASDTFGAYKLPFVDIVDGQKVAVRAAIFAANSAMSGARGGVNIPASDRPRVQAHIDRYRRKIQQMDERENNAITPQIGALQREVSMPDTSSAPVVAPTVDVEAVRAEAATAAVAKERQRLQAIEAISGKFTAEPQAVQSAVQTAINSAKYADGATAESVAAAAYQAAFDAQKAMIANAGAPKRELGKQLAQVPTSEDKDVASEERKIDPKRVERMKAAFRGGQ